MRISEAAKQIGVSVEAVRKWTNEGYIKSVRSPHGHRIYRQEDIDEFLGVKHEDNNGLTAFYIRVSDGNATAMENQEKELEEAFGTPGKVYKDKASGLSEKRPGLNRLIRDAENGLISHVKVTYPDRLTRFGFSYVEHILNSAGADVETLHAPKEEPHEELMADFMSLIASFSGRFYKMRSVENQKRLLSDAETKLDTKEGN